jgi:integral membrane sensor domain MASE1
MVNTSANSGRLLSKLRSYPYWIQFALVAATYYLSRILFMFQIKQGSFAGAFIYAPIGLGLAALLILGYRIWPAIAVGAFFVHLEGMNRLPFALSSMTSNTLEALLSAYLLQRFTEFDLRLQRRKDVLGFVGLSVVLATAICATIGAVLYCLAGVVPWRRFENFWFLWWRVGNGHFDRCPANPRLEHTSASNRATTIWRSRHTGGYDSTHQLFCFCRMDWIPGNR